MARRTKLHETCALVSRIESEEPEWLCTDRCPQVTPIPADPARDERIRIYRDRERNRAARALDRWIESVEGCDRDPESMDARRSVAVAGERFVEAVGDYVLARLGQTIEAPRDRVAHAEGAHDV